MIIYIENPEGVEPTLEDHPSARRLARYLLENIDYDVLEQPLSFELLAEMEEPKPAAALIMGYSRNTVLAGVAALVLVLCVLAFVLLGGGSSSQASPAVDAAVKHRARGTAAEGLRRRGGTARA